MIRHYLTFQHQAELLHQNFVGWTFDSCWSQEKERVYLKLFQGDTAGFIEISLNLRFGYALPLREVHRAKKNTIDQFTTLSGSILTAIYMHESERAIHLQFDNNEQLLLFFYGKGAGNIVRVQSGEVIESFMSVADEYNTALSEESEIVLRRDDLIESIIASGKPLLASLSSSLRSLGKRLASEAVWRAGLWGQASVRKLDRSVLEALLNTVDQLYAEAAGSMSYYVYYLESDVIFSLICLTYLEENLEVERREEFDDIVPAIRACRAAWFWKHEFGSKVNELKKRLRKEEERVSRSLAHAENSTTYIERAELWEMIGNLLLLHLSHIKKGDEQVALADWEGIEREIKLDRKRTPAENAERYFKKARGARMESERSQIRAKELRGRLAELRRALERLEQAQNLDDLDQLQNDYRAFFPRKGTQKEIQSADRYRRFVVDGGLEVFAGKNAVNNDELTLRFARPNDVWLHARGSSGSHVVLRWNNPKGRPPKRALEEAAMIAAFYSGAKHSNLVPVAWTRRKYVRKPKGASPGAVIVSREEVVMVRPILPKRSNERIEE